MTKRLSIRWVFGFDKSRKRYVYPFGMVQVVNAMAGNGREKDIQNSDPLTPPVEAPTDLNAVQQAEWAHRRILQLVDESRRHAAENHELREKTRLFEQEQRRLSTLLREAQRLVLAMEEGIQTLRRSISLQLGYLITHSLGSVGDMLALPLRIFRLLRDARRRNGQQAEGTRPVVHVPLPYDLFPSELRQELEQFQASAAAYDASANPAPVKGSPSSRFAALSAHLSELRIASVMDEFTFSAYRDCCELSQLTPEGWRTEVHAFRPHLLFIESAWDGKNSLWQRKVSGTSKELLDLTAHCRKVGIPVIFWSKEDPVHFKTFLDTARQADVVFTTDIDCVKHYKTELGHDRVFLLPFATQPLTHNPLERYQRRPGFCFAGSYYVRYPIRQRDFDSLIQAVSSLGPLDIYDRNHGKEHPNYIFPEKYRRYILGSLPFDEIDVAYKGYEFGININTVKNSQSMFARRVFDLLASNTSTVSNYSRGLRLMFGDLVTSSDDADQLVKSLQPLAEDALYRRKHRLAGLRKVMREHTYQHRLGYIFAKVYGETLEPVEVEIVVLAKAGSHDELNRLLVNFNRQTWLRKRLVLQFGAGFTPAQTPVGQNIQVLSQTQADARPLAALVGSGYVAGFHADDYYGPNYLTDLALAVSYSPASAIGKVSHYRLQKNVPVLQLDGAQYRLGSALARRRGMAMGTQFPGDTVSEWTGQIDLGVLGTNTLALDEFNYCANATAMTDTSIVDDLVGLDEGMALGDLLAFAERIPADRTTHVGSMRDESSSLPHLDAANLFARLGDSGSSYLSFEMDNSSVLLRSTLPAGRHAYVYLSGDLTPGELHFTDIAKLQLVCERSDGLELVLTYKDPAGGKISHSILKAGANVTVAAPGGMHMIGLGLRVSKAGDFRIRRLALDHVPLEVDAMVTRSRYLLLAKNYPSYQDLYKHAFVHRRVAEYRRSGIDVDVFRIGGNGLSFYEFDGLDVAYGQADHLRAMLRSGSYDAILTHVLDEPMWEVLQEFVDSTRLYVWAHGSEIQSANRRECDHVDAATRTRAVALGERRMHFWRRIFEEGHPNLKMVFVSEWSANDVMEDVGVRLPEASYEVVHNFIDGNLFKYVPKDAAQRKRILSIRPFASHVYANDLTVRAIQILSAQPFFDELQFTIIGDGPLFDETVKPLLGFANVTLEKRFMTQRQIAELHRDYGVFLVPSRMDSHGVSRDEAMASGLVPVTTRVAAIPEFVDESCGLLADTEDAAGLAHGIAQLYGDPDLFLRLSKAAASRVRQQSGYDATIAREIALFKDRSPRCQNRCGH